MSALFGDFKFGAMTLIKTIQMVRNFLPACLRLAAPLAAKNHRAETGGVDLSIRIGVLLVLCLIGFVANAQTDYARPSTSAEFDVNTVILSTSTSTGNQEFNLDTRAISPDLFTSETGAFLVDARSGALASLVVTGPTQIPAGTVSSLECHLIRPNLPVLRLTDAVEWSFMSSVPAGVRLLRNTLTLPPSVQPGLQVRIRASFTHLSARLTSPAHTVTVGTANLKATATAEWVAPHTALQAVTLKARAWGGQSPHVFRWDVDRDGSYGDVTGAEVTTTLPGPPGTYRLSVEVTDAAGEKARASRDLTLDRPLVPGQPERLRPVGDAGRGTVFGSDGHFMVFNSAKIGNGCAILTHGLYSEGFAPWIRDMARRIDTRLGEDGPNVAVYDWGADTDPGGQIAPWKLKALKALGFVHSLVKKLGKKVALRVLRNLAAKDVLEEAGEVAAEEALKEINRNMLGEVARIAVQIIEVTEPENLARELDFAIDAYFIRPIALNHGQMLADWILLNAGGPDPRIDPRQPLHLIGHSAGGFLMGQAALWLKRRPLPTGSLASGVKVSRVTMLDTPFPFYEHLVTLPNPARVEQVISSVYGYLEFPGSRQAKTGPYFSITELKGAGSRVMPDEKGHGLAYRWYARTILPQNEADGADLDALGSGGFDLSPWGSDAPSNAALVPRDAIDGEPEVYTVPVNGWETFGQVAETDSYWKLTEEANAGVKATVNLPVGATTMSLKVEFANASDGDFLCIRFGEEPDLTHVLNTVMTRDGFAEISVPVEAYGGQSGLLIVELISRGTADSSVKISKEISVKVLEDADDDGLSTTQEISMGLLPDDPDSDGDGLPDGLEVSDTQTNPLLADSDWDGADDKSEIAAGTDPLANDSLFELTDFLQSNANQQLSLRWRSVAGKTYRVLGSDTLDRDFYQIISPELQASGDSMEWSGSEPDGIDRRAFFWVEVIP
ncbi:MAG TPA: hypothetical protein VG796_07205 [Verrucomicrobiales bacterium]|nr:hypothetical protein [Verrucomicrobiales bacterium]